MEKGRINPKINCRINFQTNCWQYPQRSYRKKPRYLPWKFSKKISKHSRSICPRNLLNKLPKQLNPIGHCWRNSHRNCQKTLSIFFEEIAWLIIQEIIEERVSEEISKRIIRGVPEETRWAVIQQITPIQTSYWFFNRFLCTKIHENCGSV